MEEDGWVYSHHAIRADLADTDMALTRMVSAGKLEDWELPALKTWWGRVCDNIHQHHDHEERIFFPRMKARPSCVLSPKMSSDHKTLLTNMKAVSETMIKATSRPFDAKTTGDLKNCAERLRVLSDHMLPHLTEEEKDCLPALRKAFSPKEVQKEMTSPMIKEFTWLELPHFYRRFFKDGEGGMPAVRAHATQVLGMPGFVFDHIENIPKKIRRYNCEYGFCVEELMNPSKRAGCEAERAAFARAGCTCVVL